MASQYDDGTLTEAHTVTRFCDNPEAELDGDLRPCEWEGEVEVTFEPISLTVHHEWWTCPRCGYEHHEDQGE